MEWLCLDPGLSFAKAFRVSTWGRTVFPSGIRRVSGEDRLMSRSPIWEVDGEHFLVDEEVSEFRFGRAHV